MKARWTLLLAAAVAVVTVIPLATAGAQDPTTSDPNQTVEGSAPLGGDVNCQTAPTLTPEHGPPGTLVTVTASFQGNCDEFGPNQFGITCEGTVTGDGVEMSFPFAFGEGPEPAGHGEFTAPATEPNPPIVDAIEPLTVTITCTAPANCPSPAEGCSGAGSEGNDDTNYHYPPVNYDLELFADTDTDQPTIIDRDGDGEPDVVPGVINATPPFTG